MEIKDAMRNILEGDVLTNALSFVDFVTEKGLNLKQEWDKGFRVVKNNKSLCMIILSENNQNVGEWLIWEIPVASEPGWDSINNDLKDFIIANIKICDSNQGKGCGSDPGSTKNIFGKSYDNVCTSELQFINPGTDVLDKFKEVVEWWITNIAA